MNFFWFQWALCALIYSVAINATDVTVTQIKDFDPNDLQNTETTETVETSAFTKNTTEFTATTNATKTEQATENQTTIPNNIGYPIPPFEIAQTLQKPCINSYYMRAYNSPKLQWTCKGWVLVQTIDCYLCIPSPGSEFADCTQVINSRCY